MVGVLTAGSVTRNDRSTRRARGVHPTRHTIGHAGSAGRLLSIDVPSSARAALRNLEASPRCWAREMCWSRPAQSSAHRPLLQDGVLAVPQRKGEAEVLLVVGDPAQAVLAPAIRPGPRLVMGEKVPGIAVVAVILPHRPPLPVREIRSPFPPGNLLGAGCFQSTMLGIHLRPPGLSEGRGSCTSTLRSDAPRALRVTGPCPSDRPPSTGPSSFTMQGPSRRVIRRK